MAGLLTAAGYQPAAADAEPDVIVINTCAVRERGQPVVRHLGQLAPLKRRRPDLRIAVAACLAQKDREGIIEACAVGGRGPGHPQHRFVADTVERAERTGPPQVEVVESLQAFPRNCRKFGTGLCRVGGHQRGMQQHLHLLHRAPLRGRERDRRPGDILGEVTALPSKGSAR